MGRPPLPPKENRNRSLGLRVTQEQYAWIAGEAKRQSAKLGMKITMSAVASKLLRQAMGSAQG